jgi:hypothetical protein
MSDKRTREISLSVLRNTLGMLDQFDPESLNKTDRADTKEAVNLLRSARVELIGNRLIVLLK